MNGAEERNISLSLPTNKSTITMATLPSKQQHPLEMASGPRDTDELEGTLLPPVAVPVDENPNQMATAAVPVTAFVYTNENSLNTADAEIPTAPFLPLYQDSQTRQEVEQQALVKGKRRGKMEAETEKEEIGKASRETYAKNYHATRKVEVANEEARRRNAQGVQVDQDRYTTAQGPNPKKKEEEEYAFQSSYKNGYEVKEYETTEYQTSDDYEVSEYKSVYDP